MAEGYGKKEISDRVLWKRLKEGDREALKNLFLRYHEDLYLYACKLSGDTYLANDCIQELFFRIWDRREYLGEVSSAKSYLWVSLRRDVFKAINEKPHSTGKNDVFSHPDMLTFTSEDFIIHDESRREQKQALIEALNQLPERHREAIVLKYFNGMGYGEIQQIMSVNYQTARNYVYHGIKALKHQFRDRIFVPVRRTAV